MVLLTWVTTLSWVTGKAGLTIGECPAQSIGWPVAYPCSEEPGPFQEKWVTEGSCFCQLGNRCA